MDEVLSQAPHDMDPDIVKQIFDKHNHQVLPTLMELWDIQEVQKDKTKWENIRDTCDSFDNEMQTMLAKAREPK